MYQIKFICRLKMIVLCLLSQTKNMKKILLLSLMFFSIKAFSQNTALIEGAIGLSQSELKTFLRGVLKGREPQRAPNTDKIAYTLENEYVHIDYYITDDSCLSAGIHFKTFEGYKKAQDEIESTCPSKAKDVYFKISVNKRIIYYTLSDEELNIVALDRSVIK
jgi:hypothetical protein